jgi:hypothetical protein
MTYTTINQVFNNYPSEFSELDQEQQQEARAEFDRVNQIESEIKKELSIKQAGEVKNYGK